MEQGSYDSDVCILEEEEVQPHLPAESPAEQEEENLFGCRGRDIFEQDDPQPHLLNPPSTVCHNSFVTSTCQPKRILKLLLVLQGQRLLFKQSH